MWHCLLCRTGRVVLTFESVDKLLKCDQTVCGFRTVRYCGVQTLKAVRHCCAQCLLRCSRKFGNFGNFW